MSEAMARALKASSPMTVVIAGKECSVRPMSIQELTEVERDCVEQYKRQYLKTFADNVDLLPEAIRMDTLTAKMDEAARWDVGDLPTKYAHDATQIKLTIRLREWLKSHYKIGEKATGKGSDARLCRLAAGALDQDVLTAAEYEKLTDDKPPRVKVPYVNWWITGAYDGMIAFTYICFKHNGVTRAQVIEALRDDMGMLMELSREIERLSTPQVGNG